MKAAFAPATAADQQGHYDPHYSYPNSQSHHPQGPPSSSHHHNIHHHNGPSPSSHHHETSPRHQHRPYPSSSYAHNDQRVRHHHDQEHPHHTQDYRPQQQEYPPRPRSPYRPPPSYYNNNEEQRSYQQHYPSHYPSNSPQHPPQQQSQPVIRHTEGYEGRVRNTNRDHNDHLMTSEHHSTHDQQQHHDQYRRDSYGFLKHPSSQYPSSHPSSRVGAGSEDDFNKFHLPPILAPEEPFYRKDLPYRHMRYFRTVTSKDREDRQGYYSSARHMMPSNTTGNFGHGPPIGVALDRFAAKQAQQYQQQQQQQQQQHQESQNARLPPLYTALPDQRPKVSPTYGHSDSSLSDQSSPTHSPMQHRPSYGGSPAQSPIEKPMSYGRQHQGHPFHQQQQQQQPGQMLKPKTIQPRSIAPAPISPTSPAIQQPEVSPRVASKRTDRQSYVKIEPKDMPLQYHQQSHSYQGQPHQRLSISGPQVSKRKWSREHSPVRQGPRLNTEATSNESANLDDASSAELHLLSSRKPSHSSTVSSATKDVAKKGAQKMKMQRYQMTTIRCWHGAIAQKSYGIEKRYLCPPPMVQVSAGVNAKQVRAEQPHVTMSVIHEKVDIRGHHGENLMEQDCSLDDSLRCSFRNLHVTGTGSDSSKRFKLGLQVYLNKNSSMPTAIMDSNPIPIISKPSKKTAKAGNASCFILNGMSVSLLNRINAQTVRTKYMAVDNNAVCAKIGSWSSFTIKMVKPPPAPPVKLVPASMGVFRSPGHSTKFVPIRMKGENPMAPALAPQATPMARSNSNNSRTDANGVSPTGSAPSSSFQFRHQQQLQHEPVYVFSNSEPVLYGSEIVLINDLTGIMTDRLIIRKVENGKVSRSGTGPVSQMQKIVLEHPDRVHPEDGRAYYLSASSIGSPKIEGKIPLQAAMDRSPLLEYRTSSKKASIMDMTDNQDDDEEEMNEDDMDYNSQNNGMPRRMGKNHDSVAVDDFVCWTIAGIAKFDYTYFGPIPASVDSDVDPNKVPSIQSCPQYNSNTNTMTMTVKNVFEKLTPAEEARLLKHQEDPYERKLTLSEYVYKRCEDIRQPMRDEEGPIQLWLAQHGPIRMRRRQLEDVLPEGVNPADMAIDGEESSDEESSEEEEEETEKVEEKKVKVPEDPLPKIASKSSVSSSGNSSVAAATALASAQDAAAAAALAYATKHQTQLNIMNGRHYGGSHLPASLIPGQKQKRRKLVKKLMGLEAELPYGCEVRAAHDTQGHARAELDILMVERSSGIAYRTGYKVVYSRERERADWVVEVLG
ncbi:hypothetical protein FBU30_008374 [Linnemannia zychae]|nr:hypothetical protein FBU30_008374 [Linnemannia zychae]